MKQRKGRKKEKGREIDGDNERERERKRRRDGEKGIEIMRRRKERKRWRKPGGVRVGFREWDQGCFPPWPSGIDATHLPDQNRP